MGYSREAYDNAVKILKERKYIAEDGVEYKKQKIYSLYPELKELDFKLAQTMPKLTMFMFNKHSSALQLEEIKQENIALNITRNEFIQKNNIDPDYDTPSYACPICKDSGFIGIDMCSCMEKLISDYTCNKIASESNMELTAFNTFDLSFYPEMCDGIVCRKNMKQTLEYCKYYADNFTTDSGNILFTGRTGLGKTHLSLAIANQVIKNGNSVVYVTAPGIFRKLEKERFDPQDSEKQDSFTPLIECDLLIIDDLGAEFSTQFTNSMLYDIINTRLNKKLPFIINTNLNPNELDDKYSERITSRLLGCSDMFILTGNDIRIEKLKRR